MFTCGLPSDFTFVTPQAEGVDIIDDPENETFLDIQSFLEGFNFTMDMYGLPTPVPRGPPFPRLHREEMRSEAQWQELQSMLEANLPSLNADQCNVYDTVLSVMADQASPQVRFMAHHLALTSWLFMYPFSHGYLCTLQRVLFLDGPSGTGKTFMYSMLLASVRARGGIALSVATSLIAALLLDGGKTAHSRFKIPIQLDESSTCG